MAIENKFQSTQAHELDSGTSRSDVWGQANDDVSWCQWNTDEHFSVE